MRVCVIVGTRPEAIKLAPVVHALEGTPGVACSVVSTGQDRQMLDQALDVFGILPDVELSAMRSARQLGDLTARLVSDLGETLTRLAPDRVLVQGDTTTALCGALAAYYAAIPVGHVEAGLRTADLYSPFPGEGNRRLVAVLADRHYAPTARSADNLLREGVAGSSIVVTGNTVIDALLWAARRTPGVPLSAPRTRSRRILVTLHRRESQGETMRQICLAIREVVETRDAEVVLPVHHSAAVRSVVHETLGEVDGVHLIEPLGYLELVAELVACDLVLTDSDGLQEEAPALAKPVLVVRDTTERPEAVEYGVARLVGTDPITIINDTTRLLDSRLAYRAMARAANPFGDGAAAQRIVDDLIGVDSQTQELAPAA